MFIVNLCNFTVFASCESRKDFLKESSLTFLLNQYIQPNDMADKWKWMLKLADNVGDAFNDALNAVCDCTPKEIFADYYFNDDSFIEITLRKDNEVIVAIYHKDENNYRECPNIERHIIDNLPSWDEYLESYNESYYPYDEWNEHGFRDEADYWHYRLG